MPRSHRALSGQILRTYILVSLVLVSYVDSKLLPGAQSRASLDPFRRGRRSTNPGQRISLSGGQPNKQQEYFSPPKITPPKYMPKEPFMTVAHAFLPTNTSVTYPKNMTDIFRGSWVNMNLTGANNTAGMRRRTGTVACQLLSFPRPTPQGYDYILGDMSVQDGTYTGVGDMHLALEGVYNRTNGKLWMIGHPYGTFSKIEEFMTRTNTSLDDWVRRLRRTEREHIVQYRNLRSRIRRSYEYETQRSASNNGQPRRNKCQWIIYGHATPDAIVTAKVDEAPSEISELVDIPTVVEEPMSSFSGYMYSIGCETVLRIETSVKELKQYASKITRYVYVMAVVSVIQVVMLIRQMRYSHTLRAAMKLSILTLGQQALLDGCLCLFHIYNAILQAFSLNLFFTATFFTFVVLVVFEIPYLLTIWKARQPGLGDPDFAGENEGLQSLFVLARIYLLLIGYVVLGFYFLIYWRPLFPWLIWVFYLYWTPQIVVNIILDNRKQMDPLYIIVMGLSRLVAPLYFFGCPSNFLAIRPNYVVCFAFVVAALAQIGLLLHQHAHGSRAFIPQRFLPEKYDYFRPIENRREGDTDCVICMMEMDGTAQEMIAPCDHIFHAECLERWMEIKMECPTCRADLPAI